MTKVSNIDLVFNSDFVTFYPCQNNASIIYQEYLSYFEVSCTRYMSKEFRNSEAPSVRGKGGESERERQIGRRIWRDYFLLSRNCYSAVSLFFMKTVSLLMAT